MILVTFLPYLIFMSGWIYLASAIVLNLYFLYMVLLLMFSKRENVAMKTFVYSINYLLLLFVSMVVDHYLVVI